MPCHPAPRLCRFLHHVTLAKSAAVTLAKPSILGTSYGADHSVSCLEDSRMGTASPRGLFCFWRLGGPVYILRRKHRRKTWICACLAVRCSLRIFSHRKKAYEIIASLVKACN